MKKQDWFIWGTLIGSVLSGLVFFRLGQVYGKNRGVSDHLVLEAARQRAQDSAQVRSTNTILKTVEPSSLVQR